MSVRMLYFILGAAAGIMVITLQGCGGGGGGGGRPLPPPPSPAPPPTPPPTPPPPPPPSGGGWSLKPVQVVGSRFQLPDGTQFKPVGIGFPNVYDLDAGGNIITDRPKPVSDWIKVLQRIKNLSPDVNLIRLYQPPPCWANSTCMYGFFKEADRLGVYVMVPGSGLDWGYFASNFDAAAPGGCAGTVQGCYQNGGLLGFGRQTINTYNYPNTFAIIIGNEWESNLQAFPVLKAYARDLNYHMTMCNTNDNSPTKGNMRGIPLMYASTDAHDAELLAVADYLFCGDAGQYSPRVNAFGVNMERWVDGSPDQVKSYQTLSTSVLERKYPGAWFHSEEGGPVSGGARDWSELPNFFTRFPGFNGFAAYAYYAENHNGFHPDYSMFSSPYDTAEELDDAKKFFSKVAQVGDMPAAPTATAMIPTCPAHLTFNAYSADMMDYSQLRAYDTGKNTLAAQCPQPWQTGTASALVETAETIQATLANSVVSTQTAIAV